MGEEKAGVAATCEGLADFLAGCDGWTHDSLCAGWEARHVVAHLTMPVRLTPERFGQEMAAAGGDFGRLSDTVALRDGDLPREELLDQLRSPELHAWEPPGGGAIGALTHAVVHSLDVTLALGRPAVAPHDAVETVLGAAVDAGGSWFGVDLHHVRLEAPETGRAWGEGDPWRADTGSLLALVAGRTLPDGRRLPRRQS